MKSMFLSACALFVLSSLAVAGPQEQLTQILKEASSSSNPSVSFLQGIGDLGNADMNASEVAAAVQAAPIHAALAPVLERIQRIKIDGSSVRFEFESNLRVSLAGKAYAHFSRTVTFRVRGNKLDKFKGFKLSESASSMKVKPRSIEFGTSSSGVPMATVKLPLGVTKRIELTSQSASLGLSSAVSFG